MRIVVTGASGNVGSALLRRLLAGGHDDVVGLARRVPEGGEPFASVRWRSVDLTGGDASPSLASAFAGADAVVHLAWAFQPSHDPDYLEKLGVGGTARVLEAVADVGVPHIVHMSSVGAYSPRRDDRPVDESWPTTGVPGSPYSRHKAAAERLLDRHEAAHPARVVTRLRPGIVGQSGAGSALLRYGLPAVVPAGLLRHVPVLPLDRGLVVPMVHADDVAEAVVRVLEGRVPGPFNLSAEPAVTAAAIAGALGARSLHVPGGVVRGAVSLAWHARLQPVDPGWVDLAMAVPLLDTGRAAAELGWRARVDGLSVLAETLAGMADGAAGPSAVLRRRSVPAALRRALRAGPVSGRRHP